MNIKDLIANKEFMSKFVTLANESFHFHLRVSCCAFLFKINI